jgi:hypothetical protein
MTFNGKNNQPRKRSTNTRALSTRLSNLQREMNPNMTCTGANFDGSKAWVTRKYVTTASLTSGVLDVLNTTLPAPDGAKVLKVQARNLTGRVLRMVVPSGSSLMVESGDSGAPFQGFTRYTSAPLSRFPTLVLNVPDLLARPLDTSSSSKAFTLGAASGSTDTVELMVTVRYLA